MGSNWIEALHFNSKAIVNAKGDDVKVRHFQEPWCLPGGGRSRPYGYRATQSRKHGPTVTWYEVTSVDQSGVQDVDKKSPPRHLRQFFYRLRTARSYVYTSFNLVWAVPPCLVLCEPLSRSMAISRQPLAGLYLVNDPKVTLSLWNIS
ncbi:hypothetical protein J6590_070142, partial [Homalodisca vitripennis]